jgi:hypothetical protein
LILGASGETETHPFVEGAVLAVPMQERATGFQFGDDRTVEQGEKWVLRSDVVFA